MCVPEGEVDRSGRFKCRPDGVVVMDFGKYSGDPVTRVPSDYLQWMLCGAKDMPEDARQVARWYLERRSPHAAPTTEPEP